MRDAQGRLPPLSLPGYEFTDPLETDRLLLRPYGSDDFDALYAIRSNADVARHLYWNPQTEDEVRRTLSTKMASRSIHAEGDVLALAVEHRSTGDQPRT